MEACFKEKGRVAAHTRLTEMTESSVLSYSGYELVLQEQGAEPRDLKPRAHPELCSVKSNRNGFLTFPAGPHRPPPAVRSASPPSALTHPPSPSGQALENSLLYHTCLPRPLSVQVKDLFPSGSHATCHSQAFNPS